MITSSKFCEFLQFGRMARLRGCGWQRPYDHIGRGTTSSIHASYWTGHRGRQRASHFVTMKNLCSTFADVSRLPSHDDRYISATCLDPETDRAWVAVEKRSTEQGEPAEVEIRYQSESWSGTLQVRRSFVAPHHAPGVHVPVYRPTSQRLV